MDFSYGIGSIPRNLCFSMESNDGRCFDFHVTDFTWFIYSHKNILSKGIVMSGIKGINYNIKGAGVKKA